MRISGTFLDEITHDIPSQNWGEGEWRREFELYSKIGIDTLIIIRCGYKDRFIFPTQSISSCLPVYTDLGQLFLDLAEEFGLGIYWGTYDSGHYWMKDTYWKEIEINQHVLDEVGERYASSPAFRGWYLAHETSRHTSHIVSLYQEIGSYCKAIKDVPVLISPFPQGSKQFSGSEIFTLAESLDHWDRIFAESAGAFDICAFQDGQIQYAELSDFLAGVQGLGQKHNITIWSNVESFDRDMPIKFPPADWRNLRMKLEAASKTAEKIITFEFPHFMSPYSIYPAAKNLFMRYAEMHNLDLSSLGIDS